MTERLRQAALIDPRYTGAVRLGTVDWVVGRFGLIRRDALAKVPKPDPIDAQVSSPSWVRRQIKENANPEGPLLRPTPIRLTSPFNTVRLLAGFRGNLALNARAADAWLERDWESIRIGLKGAVCFYGKRGTRVTLVGFVLPVYIGGPMGWEQVPA